MQQVEGATKVNSMVVSSGCDKLGDDVSDKRKERLKICFDRWIMKKK